MGDRESQNDPKSSRKWILPFGATLVAMMALQMSSLGFSPLLPSIQREFHMSYSQLGFFTGLYGLIAILLSIPAGALARWLGVKRVLTTGLVIVAIGLLCLSAAPTFSLALASRVLWLCGYRIAFVCVFAAIVITAPSSLRGSAVGILGAAASLSSVVGAPFGSLIARAFNWRMGIAAFSGIALMGAIFFSIFYSAQPDEQQVMPLAHGVPISSASAANRSMVYRNPCVWLMLLIGLGNMGGFAATFFVPSAVSSLFHLTSLDAAVIISAGYMAGIFTNLLVGYLADRFGGWKVMAAALFIIVFAACGMTIRNLLLFRICVAAVISLGLSIATQTYALIGKVVSKDQIGPAVGIVALGGGLFGYLGHQMLGVLRDSTGNFRSGWYMVAVGAAIALIVVLIVPRIQRTISDDPSLTSELTS